MLLSRAVSGLLAIVAIAPTASADDLCTQLFSQGYYDTKSTFTSQQSYRYAYNLMCSDKTVAYSQAQDASFNLGIPIVDILDVSLGGSTDATSFGSRRDQFCAQGVSIASASANLLQKTQTISLAATQAMQSCLTRNGFHVVVTPASNLNGFAILATFVGTGDTSIGAVSIDATPQGAITCHDDFSKRFTSPYAFLCDKPPSTTVLVTFNSDKGAMQPIEVLGTDRMLPDLQSAISSLQSQLSQINSSIQNVKTAYGTSLAGPSVSLKAAPAAIDSVSPACPPGSYMIGMNVYYNTPSSLIATLTPVCRELF